jgi:hypothetical protein
MASGSSLVYTKSLQQLGRVSDQKFGLIYLLTAPVRSEFLRNSSGIHWRVLSFVMERTWDHEKREGIYDEE